MLGFISAEHFFHHFKHLPEGELTKRRAYFVCEKSLSEFARTLGIGDYLLFGKGEVLTGGKDRPSILADAFEAVLAAIYLDGGIEPAKKFVFRFIDKADEEKPVVTDYKTTLQEIVQRNPKRRSNMSSSARADPTTTRPSASKSISIAMSSATARAEARR